jgi:hypothetical protein
MYESTFGTEWDDLDKEDVLKRAFALGVAREIGDPDPDEYERLKTAADTSYRRSLVELAYDEGRQKAAGRSGDADAVWEDLVVEPEGEGATGPPHREEGPPEMTSRPEPSALPRDDLDRLRLPAFLRRR